MGFWQDLTGWWDTIMFMCSDTALPPIQYEREVLEASDGEDFAVWWARQAPSDRLWVLIPGGLNDGRASCQQSCCRVLPHDDDVCVFHNPGRGDTRIKRRFGAGLANTTYMHEWLSNISKKHKYKTVVVIGLSLGGMSVPKLLRNIDTSSLSFQLFGVMVGSPDFIRHIFEDYSGWLMRLDVISTLGFYWTTCRSGLVQQLPKRFKWPWIPTWSGHMKPALEAAMALEIGKWTPFEKLENEQFSGFPRNSAKMRLLRIHSENDPIVRPEMLHRDGLASVEFWWTKRGGHCGQWRSNPRLAMQIVDWVGNSKCQPR